MGMRSEEGAVAITTALVLIVLILLAAFLVDLGGTRADARTDQLLADSALMAGAGVDGNAREQCKIAVRFFASNIGAGSGYDDTPCDSLPASCDSSTSPATTPSIQLGSYFLRFTHPVPVDDDAMTVQDQKPTDRDGDPCDRLKLEVRKDRDFTFAGAGGAQPSGSSVNDAVARRRIEVGNEEFASLILLDPVNCRSLVAQGGSKALVEDHPDHPGLITADSRGTGSGCSGGNGFVMLVNGSNDRICAGVDPTDIPGIVAGDLCSDPADGAPRIYSPSRETNVSAVQPYGEAANPSDVDVADVDGDGDFDEGRIRPAPVYGEPSTRLPADSTWNCMESYGTATTSDPWLPTDPLSGGCDDGHDPYIEDMASVLADSSNDVFTTMGPWDTSHSGTNCDLSGTVGSFTENIYFDCDDVNVSGAVDLRTKDYIVIRGNLNVSGTVNVDTGDDAVIVFQDGGLSTPSSSGVINLVRTSVYVHQPKFSGSELALNVNLSSDCVDPTETVPNCTTFPVQWSAPTGPAHDDPDAGIVGECEVLPLAGVPSPECFHKLALWSNADDRHILKGLMDVAGVFFSPNAGRDDVVPFDLSGGATQPMHHAQFFSYRLRISGGSAVLMKPDPENNIATREFVPQLIR